MCFELPNKNTHKYPSVSHILHLAEIDETNESRSILQGHPRSTARVEDELELSSVPKNATGKDSLFTNLPTLSRSTFPGWGSALKRPSEKTCSAWMVMSLSF